MKRRQGPTNPQAFSRSAAKNYMDAARVIANCGNELRGLLRVERPKVVDVVSWASKERLIDRKNGGLHLW